MCIAATRLHHTPAPNSSRYLEIRKMTPSNDYENNWFAGTFGWLVRPFASLWSRTQVYDELMSMDDRLLADIGISRADIPSVAAGHYSQANILSSPRLVAEQIGRVLKPETPVAHNDRAEPRVA
jgi:uncharacterized protein YjiS (DUF1127 family)